MKNLFRILLVVAIVGLAWVAFNSIRLPVEFDKEKTSRDNVVIKELMDIRTAQIAYKQEFHVHAANFAELRDWLQNGNVRTVRREVELTEEQLESGITEQKALEIVKKAQATGNWEEAEKAGLSRIINGTRRSFARDTIYMNAKQTLFGADYDVSKLGIIPFSNGKEFKMDTASVMTQSGYDIKIFEASTSFRNYLGDLSENELENIIDRAEQTNKFPGLKVGSLTEINNYAGNWE